MYDECLAEVAEDTAMALQGVLEESGTHTVDNIF